MTQQKILELDFYVKEVEVFFPKSHPAVFNNLFNFVNLSNISKFFPPSFF